MRGTRLVQGYVLCGLAGTVAAFASVLGKVGGSALPDSLLEQLGVNQQYLADTIRLLCYGAVLVCNVAMWSFYTKGLAFLPSLQATAVNTAANLFVSGTCGALIFHEELTSKWLAGIASIIIGLLFLTAGTPSPEADAPDSAVQNDKDKAA